MTEFADMRLLLVHGPGEGRELIADALAQAGHRQVVVTGDPERTLELCATEKPDLVLLDLDAPGSSHRALDSIRHLTEGADSVPVIALSADLGPEARAWAMASGVRDFVTKPIHASELHARVDNALEVRHLQRQLRDRNSVLREAVRERTGEVDTARESLSILAAIADFHDDDTSQHAQRVGIGAALIAQALDLDAQFVATIRDAAPLHDIGKVGISRRILLKPDKLTPAEWMHMMRHVEIGARILAPARSPAEPADGLGHRGHAPRTLGRQRLRRRPPRSRDSTRRADHGTGRRGRPHARAALQGCLGRRPRPGRDRHAGGSTLRSPRRRGVFHTIDRRLLDAPPADDLALRVA